MPTPHKKNILNKFITIIIIICFNSFSLSYNNIIALLKVVVNYNSIIIVLHLCYRCQHIMLTF